MNLRERLLVEKCLTMLIDNRRVDINNEYPAADLDWQLNFLSFLNNNLEDQVLYGFEFLENHKQEFKEEYDLIYPMILEYTMNRLDGTLNCSKIEENEPTIYETNEKLSKEEKMENTKGPGLIKFLYSLRRKYE